MEDIHAIRLRSCTEEVIPEEEAPSEAEEEPQPLKVVEVQTFSCPNCTNAVQEGEILCKYCGQLLDWTND